MLLVVTAKKQIKCLYQVCKNTVINYCIFIYQFICAFYTSEDLKWNAPEGRNFKSLLISDP
jgi:hypothetical protein